ncbi:MAG: DUF3817 domain-containing protein [Chitinophagaceae bacterium]|nr:MAG: DUF3817 domain-containing protein [Chitinophagaceae bacterium]
MKPSRTFSFFRRVAMAEGISFLLLLFIAMPLKYMLDQPMAVKVVGYIHGFLFVLFMALAFAVKSEYNRSWAWGIKAFLASIIPFGTFYMEKQWKAEEREFVKS